MNAKVPRHLFEGEPAQALKLAQTGDEEILILSDPSARGHMKCLPVRSLILTS
jgi:hypothetical protein